MNIEKLALAKLRCEELLMFFGVNTTVRAEENENTIELSVEPTEATSLLIGRHGETLHALQHLLNMILSTQGEEPSERTYINLDIAGYKQARTEQLMTKAKQAAEEVESSGEEKTLRPMNPAERRIVHMALAEVAGITTESIGRDPQRRIVIKKLS